MKIAIGSDHAGIHLKDCLKEFLSAAGHSVLDVGTQGTASVDYPDTTESVALAVKNGTVERGIALCGSGVGASMVANKIPGIRCSVCHDTYTAHQGVEHDDMNMLALGARVIGEELAKEIVTAFLRAHFSHEARHTKRVRKIADIESRYGKTT